MITARDVRCPYCFTNAGVACGWEGPGSKSFFHSKRVKKAERWERARSDVVISEQGLVVHEADYRWREDYWALTYYCAFCEDNHHHGGGDDEDVVHFGPRVPHCAHDDTLLSFRQVLLIPGRDLDGLQPRTEVWMP